MIAAGTTRAATRGGADLFVDVVGGEGTPILFVNSLAADHRMWGPVRAALGAPSVAYDARGHGTSPPVPGDATVADFGRDALAVLDAAGVGRAVVCGLSLGGITALWLAAQAPGRVAALVLANTALSFPPASMWSDRARLAREEGMTALSGATLDRWLTPAFRDARPDMAAFATEMVEATHPEGYAAAAAALAAAEMSEAARSWSGPTAIVAGAHDRSTPVARAEEIAAAIPQAELTTLDAAHVSALEQPEAFARIVTRTAGGGTGGRS